MKKILFLLLFCGMSLAAAAFAESPVNGQPIPESRLDKKYYSQANKTSIKHLNQARAYRDRGRYELARQSYLQALSVCADNTTLQVIQRELNGVELLLRTMR